MKFKNTINSLLLALLLILVSMAGCSQQTPSANSAPLKVRFILDYLPNTNHTGVYIARDLGYFAEEGLEVEIIQPTEGATATLIAAGQGEFGVSYQEDVTYARTAADPLPIKAIAAILQHNTSGFASAKEKNITSPKDFAGKTYAGWGSPAEEAIIRAVMVRVGADPDTLKIVQSTGSNSIITPQSQVDLNWIYYGWTGIEAELLNVELNYLPLADLHPALDFYTPVIIAAESYLAKNEETARKFLRAVAKGFEYCISNPREASELFVKAVPEYSLDLIERSTHYLNDYYIADAPRWGEMTADRWDAYTQFMLNNQLIDKTMPAPEAFTNDYLSPAK